MPDKRSDASADYVLRSGPPSVKLGFSNFSACSAKSCLVALGSAVVAWLSNRPNFISGLQV